MITSNGNITVCSNMPAAAPAVMCTTGPLLSGSDSYSSSMTKLAASGKTSKEDDDGDDNDMLLARVRVCATEQAGGE